MSRYLTILTLLSFILCSCEKEEIPVQSFDRGDMITSAIHMDKTYKYQVFYKLGTNSVISINLKTDWDIAFDCSDGNHIYLNSSKSMFLRKIPAADFNSVTDTSGFRNNRTWDKDAGSNDSTAFGILENSAVYIIDRGFNEMLMPIGFKKIQIISFDQNSYTIRYANLNGTQEQTATITKNPAYNFIAFSFTANAVALIEPEKNRYDLWFTAYTHTFYNPLQPYSVTGVLQNRNGIKVAVEKQKSFSEILLKDTSEYTFSNRIDGIGYDWKNFNLDDNTYTVDPSITYIIKDLQGFYYKLHFIDFYDEEGQKGSPKFEYEKL